MKIKYYGHACFYYEMAARVSGKGGGGEMVAMMSDPYDPTCGEEAFKLKAITDVEPKIVTISIYHPAHSYKELPGEPIYMDIGKEFTKEGIDFFGISSFGDKKKGSITGMNRVFTIASTGEGLKICHCGALGHLLKESKIKMMINPFPRADTAKDVDVLIVPVGGDQDRMTPADAWELTHMVKPKIVIPMHYKTEYDQLPHETIDKFLEGKKNVRWVGGSEIEVTPDNLPDELEIVVLEAAAKP